MYVDHEDDGARGDRVGQRDGGAHPWVVQVVRLGQDGGRQELQVLEVGPAVARGAEPVAGREVNRVHLLRQPVPVVLGRRLLGCVPGQLDEEGHIHWEQPCHGHSNPCIQCG
eukprot:369524_1